MSLPRKPLAPGSERYTEQINLACKVFVIGSSLRDMFSTSFTDLFDNLLAGTRS